MYVTKKLTGTYLYVPNYTFLYNRYLIAGSIIL